MDDITVLGPDGQKHTFPAGTTSEVIDRTMGQYYRAGPREQAATGRAFADTYDRRTGGSAPAPSPGQPRRSAFDRLRDDTVDAFQTSWIVNSFREGQAEGAALVNIGQEQGSAAQIAAGEALTASDTEDTSLRAILANPLRAAGRAISEPVRDLGRAKGSLMQGLFGDEGGVDYSAAEIAAERARIAEFARVNSEGGDSFLRYYRESDALGFVSHSAAALAGTLVGTIAGDPSSLISAGKNVVTKMAVQGGIAGLGDATAQDSGVNQGTLDEFNNTRLALSVGLGVGITGITDGALPAVSRAVTDFLGKFKNPKVAADALADVVHTPLYEGDVPPSATPSAAVNDNGLTGSLPAGATDVVRIEGGGALPGDVWDPALNAWVHRVDGPTTAANDVSPIPTIPREPGTEPGIHPANKPLTSPPVEADGTVTLTHMSASEGLTVSDPTRWGDNTKMTSRDERNRVGMAPGRTYFGIATHKPGGYVQEPGMGNNLYESSVPADKLYDFEADPSGFRESVRNMTDEERTASGLPTGSSSQVVASATETLIQQAGFSGHWTNSQLGMVATVFDPVELRPRADPLPNRPVSTVETQFEFAPDPRNVELNAAWSALTPERRTEISTTAVNEVGNEVLKALGIRGSIRATVGGWEGNINPSFVLDVANVAEAQRAADALAKVFNQQGVFIVALADNAGDLPASQAVDLTMLPSAGKLTEADLSRASEMAVAQGLKGFTFYPETGLMRFVADEGTDATTAMNRLTNALNEADGRPYRWTAKQTTVHSQIIEGDVGQADAGIPLDLYTQRADALMAEALGLPAPGAGRGLRAADNGGVAGQAGPEGPGVGPQAASGGSGGSTPPPRDGAGAAPPPEPPKGNGEGGWSDVDWGARGSPERAEAAIKHLDFLQKVIKPDQVSRFLRILDTGIPSAAEGTYVNMDWIDWSSFKGTPEETLGLQNLVADVFDDVFKAAGMKKQSHAELKRLANEMGVSLSDVAKTHADVTGDGGISVRLHVLRNVFNASAADARVQMGILRANLRKGANADDIKALAEIIERTTILGAMDKSASGEVARALNARKALSKPAYIVNDLQEALDSLNGALNDPNGIDNPLDVGKVLDDLIKTYDAKGAGGLNRKVRKIRKLGVLGYLNYLAVGNMLSAPISAFRNLVGTPMMGMGDLASRYITAGTVAPTRKALLALGGRTDRHVTAQDTFALLEGAWEGMGPSLHLGLQAAIKGAPIYDNLSSSLLNNPQQVPYALSKARMAKWQKDGFTLDTIADVAGVGLFEVVRTVGFRPSAAADEMYKSLNRHAAIRSYAIREANYQASRQSNPADAKRTYDETLKGIMDDPTAEAVQAARDNFEAGDVDLDTNYGPGSSASQHQAILMGIDLRKAAEDHALLQSFQNTGPMVRAIDGLLRKIPLFRTLAANFVNTPAQILVAAFRDYNPILAGPILAMEALTPTGRARHAEFFRALKGEEDSLTAGPAAELAIGKMAFGSMVMATMGGVWAAGNLVGNNVPEGDEYEGVRPNSIKLPGLGWTEFTGFAPAAMTMGLIADMGHLFRTAELTHDQQFSLAGAVGVVVRLQLQNLPVLQGLETVITAMSGKKVSGDDDGAAGRAMEQAKNDLLLIRVTPAGNLLKKITEDVDPVMRDARGFFQQLQANVPGLSSGLVASRDFMGRVRTRQDAASGALQLLKTSAPTGDALDQELHSFKSRVDEPWEPSAPSRFLDGIELTPDELARMTEVQGQLYRDRRTGRNMEEALRHLITTPEYLEAGRYHQPEMFGDVVSDYRRAGKAAVHNPSSPHYMRDMAVRIGPLRAARDASQRGLDAPAAMRRRGQTYGLLPQDQEALASALAEIN